MNKLAISAVVLASAAFSPDAWAQEAASDDEAAPLTILDEVIVTAQRRETDRQDTPVAVTALSELQMERRGISRALDLSRQVPNLVASNNITLSGSNSYYLRGIGSLESLATFDPPVITYVDEVVDPRQIANNVNLLDIERVEVLRGPQGTLFGRNTTGGAISIVTRKPSPEFEVKGSASYGRFDEVTVKGSANVPLGDRVFSRVSAFYTDDDGWQRSAITDELYNGKQAYGARAALRLELTDTIRWDLSGDWQYQRGQTLSSIVDPVAAQTNRSSGRDGPWVLGSGNRNDVFLSNCTDGDTPFEWVRNGCTASEVQGHNIYSNLQIDTFEQVTINLISGYRNNEHRFVSPLRASLREGAELPLSTEGTSEMVQQELKLNGEAFGNRLTYVTGLFYLKEDNFTDFETSFATPEDGVFLVLERNRVENDSRSFAWYGQADLAVTERLTLTAGLRWTREKKTIPFYGFTSDVFPAFDIDDIVALGTPDRVVTRQWTPRFVAQYAFSDDVMAYASATRGFKSGGWSARAREARFMIFFDKETVWSYEVGTRAEWFDRRLRTNATLFHVTYDDLQLPTLAFIPGPGDTPTFTTTNVGKMRVRGVEMEASAVIAQGLSLYATVGLQDADYKTISQPAVDTGILLDNDPQRVPDVTLTIGGQYQTFVDALNGDLYANVDAQVLSAYFVDSQNTPNARNPGHTTINAAIGYDTSDGLWGVQLSCRNCFGKRYFTDQLLDARFINDPMRWLLTVHFRYS